MPWLMHLFRNDYPFEGMPLKKSTIYHTGFLIFFYFLLFFSQDNNFKSQLQQNSILQKSIFEEFILARSTNLYYFQYDMSEEDVKFHAQSYGVTAENEVKLLVQSYRKNNFSLVEDCIAKKKWAQLKAKISNKMKVVCRFEPQGFIDPSNKNQTTIDAVIIGPCGSGKTCLINHLCGSDLPSGLSNSSLTRNVTQLPSQFLYQPQFILYDTPGTTAVKEKMQHAVLVKEILTWKPVNTVYILVDYKNRFDELISRIKAQVNLIKGYEHLIVFLVSHFDNEKDPEVAIQAINKMLTELRIPNNIIFFSNKSCHEKELTDKLYYISASMPKTKIQISTTDFLLNFNLTRKAGQDIFFEKQEKDAFEEMKEITLIYAKFALSLPNNEERQSILQDLQVSLKRQLVDILQSFQKKFNQTIVGCQFYRAYYSLQKTIVQKTQEFQTRIRRKETYKLIENQATGNKTDIRDLIKKCSNCGLIWFRIEACPNTVCGNRPSCFFDFLRNAFSNFKITRTGKKITLTKTNQVNNLKQNGNEQNNKKNQYSSKTKASYLGCNQAMNFQSLPRLPDIEDILKRWYNVSSMEEVISKFLNDQKLQETRMRFEKDARSKFGSFI